MERYLTLSQIAEELSVTRSALRRYVKLRGFEPVRIRTPTSSGQLCLALSETEAARLRQLRAREGFGAAMGRPATVGGEEE